MSMRNFDRRRFLRGVLGGGAAVCIGLPTLDIFVNSNGTALANGQSFPKRFGVFFWGNGVLPNRWVPTNTGPGWTPSDQLAPLAGVKDYINVVSGMNMKAKGGRGHHDGTAGILSGAKFIEQSSGDSFASTFGAPSIDQVVAAQIGTTTRFKSLEVGVSKLVSDKEGTTLQYLSHNGPDNANPPEYSPAALFNRIFGGGFQPPGGSGQDDDPERARRRSVLDAVMEDAARLRTRLGTSDQARLDQHLEGVRALERQLSPTTNSAGGACEVPGKPTDPADRYPELLAETNRPVSDLIAMALACDQTRVFSNMFSGSVGGTRYPGTSQNHHSLTHFEGGSQPQVHQATVFIMERFNELVLALKSIPEGDGTLLDNCCVLATTDTAFGRDHTEEDYPILVAGGGGGALRFPGTHYRSSNGENTSKVLLSLLHAMDINATEFGAGQGRVTSPLSAILK